MPILGYDLHWLYIGFIAQVLIMAGMVVVALLTPPPDRAQWEPFLWSPRLLTLLSDGKRRPWYQNPVLWGGLVMAAYACLYWRYW